MRIQQKFSGKSLLSDRVFLLYGFSTPQTIYKWQQGLALPTIDNMLVLATLLEVKIDDILVVDTQVQMQISA